jgi:hypothetical protein
MTAQTPAAQATENRQWARPEHYLQEMDERIREWQLDTLRFRRDARLATAEAMKADAWADYNAAVAALSHNATEVGA